MDTQDRHYLDREFAGPAGGPVSRPDLALVAGRIVTSETLFQGSREIGDRASWFRSTVSRSRARASHSRNSSCIDGRPRKTCVEPYPSEYHVDFGGAPDANARTGIASVGSHPGRDHRLANEPFQLSPTSGPYPLIGSATGGTMSRRKKTRPHR